jgi:FAD/FMN-containing dehydrogenase
VVSTLSRLEPPLRSPRDRKDRFVNYSGTVTVSPVGWESPSTEEEVSKCVASAAASGRRVRVVGAGHSWSAIAAPEDLALTLDRLSGIVARGPGWVRVRSGTRLRHLNRALAAGGETLPIVASIAQQTVGGVVATGTHGSSLCHGNLSSLVLGARVVTGDGSVLEIAAADERLEALRVNLGALGPVTEVTLRTVPDFNLAETIEELRVDQVAVRVEELGRSAEFVKVWWFPHTTHALVIRHDRTKESMTRRPSPQTQRMIENWLPRVIVPVIYGWHQRHTGGVTRFNRVAARWLIKKRRVGPSTLMLSTPEPVRHYETEAAVPLAAGGEAFDRTVRLVRRHGLPANFILELRYTRGDAAWMSTAYGGDVIHLGACTAIRALKRAYFDAFWQEMRPLGGRPHWAKEMDHDALEIRSLYPMADRFLDLRNRLDPQRLFANRFLDRTLGT